MESESIGLTIRRAIKLHKQRSEVEAAGGREAGEGEAGGGGTRGGEARGGETRGGQSGEGGTARYFRGALGRVRTALASLVRHLAPPIRRVRRLESGVAEVRDQLDSLRERMRRLEERERPAVPRPGEMALNLTSKTTALKLARSGQNARQIARTLGVPAGEIELLLKVERLQCQARASEREGLAGNPIPVSGN